MVAIRLIVAFLVKQCAARQISWLGGVAILCVSLTSTAHALIDELDDSQLDPSYVIFDYDDLEVTWPITHRMLPSPLFHATQPNLQAPSHVILVSDSPRDFTVSAWVHLSEGKALTLLSDDGQDPRRTFRLGIGSASVLGQSASAMLGMAPELMPELFLFFAQSSSASSHFLSTIWPLDISTITHNGIEWQHISLVRNFGLWGAYSDGSWKGFAVPWALNHPIGVYRMTTETPIIADAQFGGHIGQITIYPDILATNLVSQLASHNPFGVPEPTSATMCSVGIISWLCLVRQRVGAAR